jgi:hypothetical protein
MASPHDPTDPVHLTPDQRLDQLAALLALSVRRVLDLRAITPLPDLADSLGHCLDVVAELSVHATTPVNATGEAERSSR